MLMPSGYTPISMNCNVHTNLIPSDHLQTASQFMSQYFEAVNEDINQGINLTNYTDGFSRYSYQCHEATIAFAYALNQTIAGK